VIVDSFRTVTRAAERAPNGGIDTQNFVQQLAVQLSSWEATTFLVGEYDHADPTMRWLPRADLRRSHRRPFLKAKA
jgi:hypothetical protein